MSRRPFRAFGAACLVSLAACAPLSTAPETRRVLVEFREAQDAAAPALVARLQSLSGAHLQYLAPVSPTLHAYAITCPTPSCDAALAALLRDPAVRSITPDALRKPSETPP